TPIKSPCCGPTVAVRRCPECPRPKSPNEFWTPSPPCSPSARLSPEAPTKLAPLQGKQRRLGEPPNLHGPRPPSHRRNPIERHNDVQMSRLLSRPYQRLNR